MTLFTLSFFITFFLYFKFDINKHHARLKNILNGYEMEYKWLPNVNLLVIKNALINGLKSVTIIAVMHTYENCCFLNSSVVN